VDHAHVEHVERVERVARVEHVEHVQHLARDSASPASRSAVTDCSMAAASAIDRMRSASCIYSHAPHPAPPQPVP
jgi:acetaldehyde dehydrogenase (acetylating)